MEERRASPVVLVIEDVHWSDLSTVDVLAYLATTFAASRLLVLATLRASDLRLSQHPFGPMKLELQTRGLCHDLVLDFLSLSDVEQYLDLEFPNHDFPAELASIIHGKTEGNALFVSAMTHYLRDQGVIAIEQQRWMLARPIPISRATPRPVRGMRNARSSVVAADRRRCWRRACRVSVRLAWWRSPPD